MDIDKLKFIKGECKTGVPADIYLFDDVDYWSTDAFMSELNWLIDYVCPSVIRLHINSAGGVCIDGIGIFSRIIDSPIPVHTYNDGLAGSIASCIWAAGKEMFMKDYALLFIHNPFIDGGTGKKSGDQIVKAFTAQISMIYKKRFGFTDEEVKKIMDGEEGNDGTFFTATEVVERGFINSDHVIETDMKDRVAASLEGIKDLGKILNVMNSANAPEKQMVCEKTITNKNTQPTKFLDLMENNEKSVSVYAALLGLTGKEATEENVQKNISELKAKAEKYDSAKAELEEAKNSLQEANTKLAGAETAKNNLQNSLDEANAALSVYREKEAQEKEDLIKNLVEGAINDCKISSESKDSWMEMARNNFDLTKSTLDSIPAREKISEKIAESSKEEVKDGLKSTEEEIKDKVDQVVGKDFEFRHL